MPVKRFRRLPTDIEAIQWTGDNLTDVEKFTTNVVGSPAVEQDGGPLHLYVAANRSWLPLEVGEWIAKDFIGFYPIKNEAILKNYEVL